MTLLYRIRGHVFAFICNPGDLEPLWILLIGWECDPVRDWMVEDSKKVMQLAIQTRHGLKQCTHE